MPKALSLSLLLIALLLSPSAKAVENAQEIDSLGIIGESAERMLAASRPTAELYFRTDRTRPVTTYRSFESSSATMQYRVYIYDANWKCYSRRDFPVPDRVYNFFAGRKPFFHEVYCTFKVGQSPQALTEPVPQPVEIELSPDQVRFLMERATPVGSLSMPVSTYVATNRVKFDRYRYSNWECRKRAADSALPFGSNHPDEMCVYLPGADSQIASGNTGPVAR